MNFRSLLAATLVAAAATCALAQSPLTIPDTAHFTSATTYSNVASDVERDRYYVFGLMTQLNGIERPGIARVNSAGIVDLSWRFDKFQFIADATVDRSGDVLVLPVNTTASEARAPIKRISGRSPAAVIAELSASEAEGFKNASVAQLFTDASGDHWIEFFETNPAVGSRQRCARLNLTTNTTDNATSETASSGTQSGWCAFLKRVPRTAGSLGPKLVAGYAGYITKLLPLANGSTVIIGNFSTFVDGRQYQSVVSTFADGRIDARLQLPANVAIGDAIVTSDGDLIVFGVTGARDPFTAAYALDTMRQRWVETSRRWLPAERGDYLYAAQPNTALSASTLYRLRKSTGQVDGTFQATSTVSGWVASLEPDDAQSLWVRRELSDTFGGQCSYAVARISLANATVGQLQPLPSGFVTDSISCPNFALDGAFAYSRYGRVNVATNQLDNNWAAAPTDVVSGPFFTRSYVYWALQEQDGTQVLRRAAKNGNGVIDPVWRFVVGVARTRELTAFAASPTDTNPDRFFVAMIGNSAFALSRTTQVLNSEESSLPRAKSVVEFYAKRIDRYFITGRDEEKALLDGLPTEFERTGMSFASFESTYRDRPEQPVCRFYASPIKQASNTHFYGQGDECALLKMLGFLEFELYDFAVKPATNGVCPADAPRAVKRMFNNRVATNNANHRYVVSDATRARMLAGGWVDEGNVFCTTTLTDAVK